MSRKNRKKGDNPSSHNKRNPAAPAHEGMNQKKPDMRLPLLPGARSLRNDKRFSPTLPGIISRLEQGEENDTDYYSLAQMLIASDRLDDARKALVKVIELNYRHSQAHNDLGVIYSVRNDYPNAMTHLKEAVIIDNSNLNALANLLEFLRRTGRNEDLQAMINAVSKQFGDNEEYINIITPFRAHITNSLPCPAGPGREVQGTEVNPEGAGKAEPQNERYSLRIKKKQDRGPEIPAIAGKSSKILMITPSFEDEHRAAGIMSDSHYPLGLAYLEAYLRQRGHQVKILFLNDFPYVNCALISAHHIETMKPDYVFIQMLTQNRVMGYKLIEYLNLTYPDIRIVIGGVHASVMGEQILAKYPFIMVVRGEGELVSERILNGHWQPGTIMEGEAFENLDELPFPNHRLFWNSARSTACLLTSRGCSFRCSFCVLDSISRRKVRFRSPKNVVDEIESLYVGIPSLRRIWIHDDNFLLDNQRAIEICREIRRRNIKLIFICSARVKPLSEELVRELEMTGFSHILFGLESGSSEILKSCHKGITREDVLHSITLFKNSPITTTYFLIAGLPGENDRTVDETIDFVQHMQTIKPVYYEDIGMLMVYPGTEVYRIAVEKGMLNDSYWMNDGPTPYYTAEHPIEEMYRLKNRLLAGIR